jgi:UDP-N-acetylmuramoylalanine--D-glutamate ligase
MLKKLLEKKNKIALLGFGQENQAFLNYLLKNKKYKNLDITICDQRKKSLFNNKAIDLKNINWQSGKNYKNNLSNYKILFRSPGWPLFCPEIKKAKKSSSIISSPMKAFFELCPSSNIIGITGSKGKGTTATLIYSLLKNHNKSVFLGGNIGIAPFSFFEKIKKNSYIVLELSSFQLEDLNKSPKIAVITNLFSDHLSAADPNNPNYHLSFKKYWQSKLNIAKYCENKYLIINQNLKEKIKKEKLTTKIIYFSKSKLASLLVGDYNQENIAAAEKVALLLKITKKTIKNTINNFKNLEHRLEFVREINNVKYYNNSFSTNPDSTILDLKSFKNPLILIAGGADKGANFKNLAKEIKKKVKFLILLPGKSSIKIKNELIKINYPKNKIKPINSMEKAILLANSLASKDDLVLLSTACASFGIFKNYKERGNQFKKYVKKIK